MCGITGFLDLHASLEGAELTALVSKMAGALSHRGPDDAGVWVDAAVGIAFGHRRLSVVDLSQAGHQPMVSASGRYVLVYNGEIYNTARLRSQFQHLALRGHSDTEVMLAAIEEWGLEASLQQFNGMFAFALWDRDKRELFLGRDRLGEKPLYYGWLNNCFLFASELSALRCHPSFLGEISNEAVALYLRHGYVPAPHSIYRNISKLLPATILRIKSDVPGNQSKTCYWSLRDAAVRGIAHPFSGTINEAVNELESILLDSVRLRCIADVPTGVFLSSGIDSSTITALLQAQTSQRVRTFSIGFSEQAYDELNDASRIARHLGTDHLAITVTPADAQAMIPKIPEIFSEPFSDSSLIPTFLLARLARATVKVALTGDGGDEIFGGYNRHVWSERIWQRVRWMPRPLRWIFARSMRSIPTTKWDAVARAISRALPHRLRHRTPGYKVHKLARLLEAPDLRSGYLGLSSHWSEPSAVMCRPAEPRSAANDILDLSEFSTFTEQMMLWDTLTYLPDNILVKVDRATMAVGLEARVPLLDPRVVEFAWRLPIKFKIRAGEGKWFLRQVLDRHVPRQLVDRAKSGFAIPLDAWLRGPLRDWAESMLNPCRIEEDGFFRAAPIRRLWNDLLAGRGAWQYHLWDILMFESWLENTQRSGTNAAISSGAALSTPVL